MIRQGENQENKKDKSSEVMERLLKTRTIFISGEINQELAEKVSTQLLLLQEMGDEPIKLFINRPSYASCNWFFKSPNRLLTGVAESMSTFVFTP